MSRDHLIVYSPSQETTARACIRAWHFERVGGFREPKSASQLYGTEIHKQLEDVITKGLAPKDPRAIAAMSNLDLHAPWRVESEYKLPLYSIDGVRREWWGAIDMLRLDPLTIIDHKTTSDLKYAKTEYELAQDGQLLSYAKIALDMRPEVDLVRIGHHSIQTKGAVKSKLITVEVDRAQVEARWEKSIGMFLTLDVARGVDVHSLPREGEKTGHCEAYRGCPHRERCYAKLFGGKKVNLKEKMAALAASVKVPEKEDRASKLEKLRAATAPKAKDPGPEESEAEAPKPRGKTRKPKAPAKAKEASGECVLYWGCAPLKGGDGAVLLEDILAPVLSAIQTETGKGWQMHEYRKGTGLIVDALEDLDLPSAIIVDAESALARVVGEVLFARCAVVIRGTR